MTAFLVAACMAVTGWFGWLSARKDPKAWGRLCSVYCDLARLAEYVSPSLARRFDQLAADADEQAMYLEAMHVARRWDDR